MSIITEEEDFPNFSLEFNFPSIEETAEKPNEQQQQARRFPSLQEDALDEIITGSEAKRTKYAPLNGVKTFKGKLFFTVLQGKLEIVLNAILSKIYSTNICNSFMHVKQYKHR